MCPSRWWYFDLKTAGLRTPAKGWRPCICVQVQRFGCETTKRAKMSGRWKRVRGGHWCFMAIVWISSSRWEYSLLLGRTRELPTPLGVSVSPATASRAMPLEMERRRYSIPRSARRPGLVWRVQKTPYGLRRCCRRLGNWGCFELE